MEIVVPSGAGGGLDTVARSMVHALQAGKITDQAINVVNKPGGSGINGTVYLNRHEGDGHYIAVGATAIITNVITGTTDIGIDDVTPLSVLVTEDIILSVNSQSKIKTTKDLVEVLKQNPKGVSIGVSTAPGGHSHTAVALLAESAGIDPKALKVVFFNSGAESTTALLGGHLDVAVTPANSVLSHVGAGTVRVIGYPSEKRLGGILADVPTWKEEGIDVVAFTSRMVMGPKGMTPEQVKWWDDALAKMVETLEWKADVERNGWTPGYRDSVETAAYVASEQQRYTKILTELGLAKKTN